MQFSSLPALLFDMDGVLLNSEPVIASAAIQALKRYGIQAQAADFQPFVGTGEDRFIGGVAEKYGVSYHPDMKKNTYEIYLTLVKDQIEIYPHTVPLLEQLKRDGIRFALASSADRVKVEANLGALGITPDYFDALVCGEDVQYKKPAPDIYLAASAKLGFPPQQCIVIEDALSGIAAAKSAGMLCIAVETSFHAADLFAAGADDVCKDIGGVYAILKRKCILEPFDVRLNLK